MVSIVILTHNKLELTKECIESIYEFTDPSTFELVIIDNASTDATPPYLSKISHQYKNIKGIYNDQNISFARGCNQGAGVAEGDYLLFLNNDTRVTPNWLDEILLVFKNEEKAGIVGSRLLYPDGRLQHAGVVLTLWNGLPINIDVNVEGEVPRTLETRKVFAVTGACMLIRKNLFFDCKGFDEEYVYGYEDIDLCMKVREKGYNIFYVPKSLLYHYASATFSEIKSLETQLKNEELFKSKWREVIEPLIRDYITKLKQKGVNRVLIYGTGRAGEMLYSVLKENGFEILGFMDSNEERWGEDFLDKRIFSFDEVKTWNSGQGSVAPDSRPLAPVNCYDAILIASQFISEIKSTLEKNGITENIIAPIIS